MQTFLMILGGITLFVLLIIGFFVLKFVLNIRNGLKLAKGMIGGLDFDYAELLIPSRIKVRQIADEPVSYEYEEYQEVLKSWKKHGFQQLGRYSSEESDYLAFIHPETNWIGILPEYDDENASLFAFGNNGAFRRVGIACVNSMIELDGGSAARTVTKMDLEALLKVGNEFLSGFKSQTVSSSVLPARWEAARAHECDARNLRGGYMKDEILEMLADEKAKAKSEEAWLEMLKKAELSVASTATEGLQEACRHAFLKETQMSPAELNPILETLCTIIDPMTQGQVVEQLIAANGIPQDILDESESTRPVKGREQFQILNDTLPEASRFRKLGSVATPIAADIYALY